MTSVIPPGSVLGPVLFLVCIKDLLQDLECPVVIRYVRKKIRSRGLQCISYHWKELENTFDMVFEFLKYDKYQGWYGILKSANLG